MNDRVGGRGQDAFDTGIGTGSTGMGWVIQRYGFHYAFGLAAAISALALPYFLVVDRLLRQRALRKNESLIPNL